LPPAQPGSLVAQSETGKLHAVGGVYRPRLPVEAIQQLPPLHAWLFYRSDQPLLVETRPAGLMGPYAALSGYTRAPAPAPY
jgi:hypothetical protein